MISVDRPAIAEMPMWRGFELKFLLRFRDSMCKWSLRDGILLSSHTAMRRGQRKLQSGFEDDWASAASRLKYNYTGVVCCIALMRWYTVLTFGGSSFHVFLIFYHFLPDQFDGIPSSLEVTDFRLLSGVSRYCTVVGKCRELSTRTDLRPGVECHDSFSGRWYSPDFNFVDNTKSFK